jgi:hypothetical protein
VGKKGHFDRFRELPERFIGIWKNANEGVNGSLRPPQEYPPVKARQPLILQVLRQSHSEARAGTCPSKTTLPEGRDLGPVGPGRPAPFLS